MWGDQSARQRRNIRAFEASPNRLTVAEKAQPIHKTYQNLQSPRAAVFPGIIAKNKDAHRFHSHKDL